ncbi:DUF1499 domain-containing protein [Hyphococcus sp.]|uniref:DUF1499 domain-containing protein n=1 Tax=Hyphococcus sp. TaxID=2038636 RepID=UPI0020801A45|nr:MAG: hypothetical protein DHS20C04_18620 [Marinicaulis sp.]
MVIWIIAGLALAAAATFFFLAQKSKAGIAIGLVDGVLAPCPAAPNCVSSEAGTPESHAITALPASAWDRLPDIVLQSGGRLIEVRRDYLAAEFSTKLMGYVDDVEFRKAEDAVHVRSASRVGHSDFGVNRKRVEALRAALRE